MTALVYEKQGKIDDAKRYYEKVIAYTDKEQFGLNSNRCLIAISYHRSGKIDMAEDYIQNWLIKDPDSNIARWCDAVLNGKTGRSKQNNTK